MATPEKPPEKFGPWLPGLSEAERRARFRCLASLAYCYLNAHSLARHCVLAENDERYAEAAWVALNDIAPLPQRSLLSAYAAIDALVVTNGKMAVALDTEENDPPPVRRRARK